MRDRSRSPIIPQFMLQSFRDICHTRIEMHIAQMLGRSCAIESQVRGRLFFPRKGAFCKGQARFSGMHVEPPSAFFEADEPSVVSWLTTEGTQICLAQKWLK